MFYAPPLMRGSPCSQVVIREASRQPWSPAHHLLTPPAFQQQVATLLLCHWRLARSGAPPQGRAAQERAASAGWRERLRSAMLWPCRLPDLERRGQQAEHAGPKEEEAGLLPAAQHQLGLGDLPQVMPQTADCALDAWQQHLLHMGAALKLGMQAARICRGVLPAVRHAARTIDSP